MSDSLIGVSAQLPHPFQPDVYVQMWWQETRHPSVKGTRVPLPLGSATCSAPDAASAVVHVTSAATMLVARAAPAVASPRRGSQGWGSSFDDEDNYQGTGSMSQRLPTPWVSSSSQPPPPADVRVPTTPPVSLPPGIQSLPASDVDSSLSGFLSADCPLRLRVSRRR